MMAPALRGVLAVHAIALGLGYLLGPPQFSTSTSFAVVKQLGVPVQVWGAAFTLAGLLLLAGLAMAGHALALFALTFWGCCLGATLFTGELSAWGGPVHVITVASIHGLGLFRHSAARAAPA